MAYESEGTHERVGTGVRGEGRAGTSVAAWRGTEFSVTAALCCTGQHANLNLIDFLKLIDFLVPSLPDAPRDMASANPGEATDSSDAPPPIADTSIGAGAGAEGLGGLANPVAGLSANPVSGPAAASPAAQPPPPSHEIYRLGWRRLAATL